LRHQQPPQVRPDALPPQRLAAGARLFSARNRLFGCLLRCPFRIKNAAHNIGSPPYPPHRSGRLQKLLIRQILTRVGSLCQAPGGEMKMLLLLKSADVGFRRLRTDHGGYFALIVGTERLPDVAQFGPRARAAGNIGHVVAQSKP
jgi:hypothetical protein